MFTNLIDHLAVVATTIIVALMALTIIYTIYSLSYDRHRKGGPEGNLKFFGQPQFDINSHILGYELLLRKLNQTGEWVVPDRPNYLTLNQFLSLFKVAIQEIPAGQNISINLSAEQLMNASFEPFIKSLISQTTNHQLAIEISFADLNNWKSSLLINRMNYARSLGAKICLDSVGSHAKDLRKLSELAESIDYLKCSMDEYRKTDESDWLDMNLGAWLIFAQSHGIKLVLSRVETNSDHILARYLGINYVQGWYVGEAAELKKMG